MTGGDREEGARRAAVLIAIAVATGATAVMMRRSAELPTDALIEGLAFVGAGLAAWARRPDSRVGRLMILYTPLAWSVHLLNTEVPVLWTIGGPLFIVSQGLLAYTIVTFPAGRATTRLERVVFWLAVINTIWQTAALRFVDPRALGCADCPEGLNLLLIEASPAVARDMAHLNFWLVSAIMVTAAVVLVTRWARATQPSRRVLGPIVLPALAFVAANRALGVAQAYHLYAGTAAPDPEQGLLGILGDVEQAAVIVLPLTFLVGTVRARLLHARVSRLVVELGDLQPARRLEAALSRALRDPRLEVGLWDPATRRYVRAGGEEITPPDPESGLVGTRLEREGAPLALMVHDEALLDEPGLVEATAAAARLAVENERLQAELAEQLEAVRASRQRLVAAQDEERRRLERDLHDGAQQRLLRLSMALEAAEGHLPDDSDPAARSSLHAAAEELQAAMRELRDLAGGLHPAVLTQRGLGAALHSLAEAAALPVILTDVPPGRLPAAAETAAYFVASEALANAAKHASASHATVSARVIGDDLQVTVADDGIGGATPSAGSGLRGLRDRVQAVGGQLDVDSNPGSGTRVAATIPLSAG